MGKLEYLKKLSTDKQIIGALAIDQRGAIRKMMTGLPDAERDEKIRGFKALVSKELTKYASSILLDPEYGIQAVAEKDPNCGLIMAYEVTGYDTTTTERYPDLILDQSVLRLKELGADAIKILLYYDVDQDPAINDKKKAFVERVGSECKAHDLPFFLEIVSFDATMNNEKSKEYAAVKPHKVNGAVRDFADARYNIDVLKLEVPVNMNYVEGYGEEVLYTKEEAKKYFKEQSDLCHVPFIFLSAGVSNQLFVDTLYLAKEAGSTFNGVLCGRATWAGGVAEYAESVEKGEAWLQTEGRQNIENLNKALEETATPWR